jgi:SulP family sulfate permease
LNYQEKITDYFQDLISHSCRPAFLSGLNRRTGLQKIFAEPTEELAILQRRLIFQTYPKGKLIIRQGEANRDLFLLTRESVTVKVRFPHGDRFKRVFTFGSGVIFGEIALLDAKPRSADVWAEEDSEVFILPYDEFVALSRETPQVAFNLIFNIAQVLSRNLRCSARELQALEDS